MEHVDLKPLVLGIVETMRPLAAAKRQVISANQLHEGSVVGCPQRLRQVVTNLLDNAIKYTPEDGRITVTLVATGADAVLTIEDSGLGIDHDDQTRIFDRFYRGTSQNAQVEGAGLGLSIVQSVVSVHRGSIEVESEPGRGSRFRVLLPLDANTSPADAQSASKSGGVPQ